MQSLYFFYLTSADRIQPVKTGTLGIESYFILEFFKVTLLHILNISRNPKSTTLPLYYNAVCIAYLIEFKGELNHYFQKSRFKSVGFVKK